jgi:hypothetical protein
VCRQEKDTTKTNFKLALVAQANASVPSNLQFALFMDGRRTNPNLEQRVFRTARWPEKVAGAKPACV